MNLFLSFARVFLLESWIQLLYGYGFFTLWITDSSKATNIDRFQADFSNLSYSMDFKRMECQCPPRFDLRWASTLVKYSNIWMNKVNFILQNRIMWWGQTCSKLGGSFVTVASICFWNDGSNKDWWPLRVFAHSRNSCYRNLPEQGFCTGTVAHIPG